MHPVSRFLFERAAKLGMSAKYLSEKSGVGRATIKAWRTRTNPNLLNVEAVLNTMGYRLELVPIEGWTPPEKPRVGGVYKIHPAQYPHLVKLFEKKWLTADIARVFDVEPSTIRVLRQEWSRRYGRFSSAAGTTPGPTKSTTTPPC